MPQAEIVNNVEWMAGQNGAEKCQWDQSQQDRNRADRHDESPSAQQILEVLIPVQRLWHKDLVR